MVPKRNSKKKSDENEELCSMADKCLKPNGKFKDL